MKQSRTTRTYRRRWLVLMPERLCSFKAESQYECPTEDIDLYAPTWPTVPALNPFNFPIHIYSTSPPLDTCGAAVR